MVDISREISSHGEDANGLKVGRVVLVPDVPPIVVNKEERWHNEQIQRIWSPDRPLDRIEVVIVDECINRVVDPIPYRCKCGAVPHVHVVWTKPESKLFSKTNAMRGKNAHAPDTRSSTKYRGCCAGPEKLDEFALFCKVSPFSQDKACN